MAIARLFQGPIAERDYSFRVSDRMALTSLLAFLVGSFFARLGDRLGNKSRRWLMLGTFMQALLTMAAAICVWKNGQPSLADARGSPSWTTALGYVATGFLSCSLGVQSIVAKRLNTQFATSGTSLLTIYI
jgi:MFS family permease